ncbi:MAG TPA: YfhO family protein [Chloroflexia bacterium]
MSDTVTLPGLLHPVGAMLLLLLFGVALFLAYRWHKGRAGRPALHLDVGALGLLALLTGGFFWRPLTEGTYMPEGGGDLVSLYFPGYAFAANQIQNGTIPLWNPHLFSGMPFAADVQMGLFYPLNWPLFLLFDLDYAHLEWLLIAHYWLASAFTYLFLRDIGLRRLGALAGAVVFAFCGFMTAHLGHMPMILVAAWLPLELLLLRRALVTKGAAGWAWGIGAGLSMGVAALAGHAQIFAYGMLAAGLLWLYLFLGQERLTVRGAVPWVLKGALAVGLALAVAAVQLLPSLELSNYSIRAAVSYEEASEFPAQPVSLLNLFLPRVYGTNPTTYYFGPWQTTENWGYCGVVTLALAAAGVVLRRARMMGFFALLVGLAFVTMVGDLSIVGAWMYKFAPGFGKLRDTGRMLELMGFGLAGLAGFGLDALVAAFGSKEQDKRRNAMWWLVGLSGALMLVAVLILPMFYRELIVHQLTPGRLPFAVNDLGMLLIWLAITAGFGWAAYKGRMQPAVAGGFIFLVLVLDLFSPNSVFNPTTRNILRGYQNFDTIAALAKGTQSDSVGLQQRIDTDTNIHDVWQPSTALLVSSKGAYTLYDTSGAFNPLQLERYNFLWNEAKSHTDSPLYDLFGASMQVVSPTVGLHANQPKWVREATHGRLVLYRNLNALPRAFLVHASRVESDREDISIVLWRQDVDVRHTVVLESGEGVESDLPGTAEPRPDNAPGAKFARVSRYTPNAVDIQVKADAPGWLVLTDAFYPGWEATVDGRAAEVLPANYAFRAVRVEAGEQTVSMQFRPGSWVVGRLVSIVAVLGAGLGFVGLWVVGRRRGGRVMDRDRK